MQVSLINYLTMKSLKSLLVLLFAAFSVNAQQVTFSPAKPGSGKAVSFVYDPAGGKLADETKIVCDAVSYVDGKQNIEQINLVRKGNIFKGKVKTAPNAELLNLSFASGETSDENPKGYFVQLHQKGVPVPMGYIVQAHLYSGGYHPFIKADQAQQLLAYEKAFEQDSTLKEKFTQEYLFVKFAQDKVKATELTKAEINRIRGKAMVAEADLTALVSYYLLLNDQKALDSVKAQAVARFPNGNLAFANASAEIYRERNPKQLEEKLEGLIQRFGLDPEKKEDKLRLNGLYLALASRYAAAKDFDKMEVYLGKTSDKSSVASLYNNIAWAMAEQNLETDRAASMSKKSIELVRDQKGMERYYAMYADTYALLLHKQGNDKEALFYQEVAKPYNDEGGNERYVMYLDLSGNKEKAYTEAESILKAGKGTDALKIRFKALYEGRSSTIPFDTYMAGIDQSAREKIRSEWAKKMINDPAPGFSLVNRKGETVSLAGLKGKTVVLDYWATWCGPCVASFPGMQKAVTKYASNPNVVFLFVNTWQREANREAIVNKFFEENKYDFNVLYDTRNKENPEVFDVISAYKVKGIPTKFVIDPKGNIRFMAVGFSGSAEEVVKEIDIMIDLASEGSAK